MKELTHRDEIHGDVDYDPLAVLLLNTPTLQRLGRVYQLGYGHLVYRGGTHTRLAHSMGTYATAGRLTRALEHNYEGQARPDGAIDAAEFLPCRRAEPRRVDQIPGLSLDLPSLEGGASALADRWTVLRHLVCWAALLHDVAHVPMGHTLEDEFEGIYEKHDAFSSPRLRHLWIGDSQGNESEIHAALTRSELYPAAFHRLGLADGEDVWGAVFLICTWKEKILDGVRTPFEEILQRHISGARSETDRAVAARLLDEIKRLMPWMFSPYMADIVANTISADYLDYLRRDPQNLGLDVLKDDRVVSRFWVGRDHLRQPRMALSLVDRRGKRRLDTCTGVVDLVRQRYRFAEIVYYHKAKVSASAMLAKVFHLVDAPDELPGVRVLPTLSDAPAIVDRLLATPKDRRAKLSQIRTDSMPASLLDTEVGDENIGMILRERALQKLERTIKDDDRAGAIQALHSITLLDAIARRNLYKVAFTMDADQFIQLSSRRDTPAGDVERALMELIEGLRRDASVRAKVEAAMVAAAEAWPPNSLLLYVPPRKSQAKGIETGALADGTVVTLGDHPAVVEAVKDLSKHYSALWRLIILVHPDHADDVIGLSEAIDAFVVAEFNTADLHQPAVIDALESCCWFPYMNRRDREAARRYKVLVGETRGSDIPWTLLHEYDGMVSGRVSGEELALGGAMLCKLSLGSDLASAKRCLSGLAKPGALLARVEEERERVLVSASREGAADDDDALRVTQAALSAIADDLR